MCKASIHGSTGVPFKGRFGAGVDVRWIASSITLALALVTGCRGDEIPGDDAGDSDSGSEDGSVDPGLTMTSPDEMYSLSRFPQFHIELDHAAMDALAIEPKVYVPGRFRFQDQTFETVGVRLKGNLSLTPLDEKPSFKIKFNEYVEGQKFIGLKKLTLHNLHQDPSMLREWLGYLLFRGVGVPAPRTGYATVVVNGEPYGVYLNLETPDDLFLGRHFPEPTGNLYEGEHGDDIHKSVDGWEQDEGDDTSRDDLRQLQEMAKAADFDLFFGESAPLDTPKVLAYLMGEAYLGHFDGYWVSHNFMLYHDIATDKWLWMPWSLDQAWVRAVDIFDGGGYVKRKCLDGPTNSQCLREYIATGVRAVEQIQALNLDQEISRVLAVIDAASQADTHKPYSNETMASRRKSIREWVAARPQQVLTQLDCLADGVEPDRDNDGYGACFQDCNDADPNVHPMVEERCDGIDNDCSGFADDIPQCECPSAEFEGARFYFCTHMFDWRDSAKFCTDQGHALARFDSRSQNDAVAAHAGKISGGRWAIGLNDRDVENMYVWPDGSTPAFTAWGEGEPAHKLDWFDCVFMRSNGAWYELNCVQDGPFICR